MIQVVVAGPEHADDMAPRMRNEDSAEVLALGLDPREALALSMSQSFVAETVLIDGHVAAMYGAIAPNLMGGKAYLWMLGTDHVPANPKVLLRLSRDFCRRMHDAYPLIECMVDARYTKAVRWIMWLGFVQVGRVPFGEVDFIMCQKERPDGY